MSKNEKLEKGYKVLFKLPEWRILLLVLVLIYAVVYIVYHGLGIDYSRYTMLTLLSFTLYFAILALLSSPLIYELKPSCKGSSKSQSIGEAISRRKSIVARRVLGLLTIYSISVAIWGILLHALLKINITYALVTAQPLIIVLTIGVHGYNSKTVAASIIHTLALTLAPAILDPRECITYTLLSTLIAITGILVFKTIDRYRVDDYSSLTLGSLFLHNWIDSNRLDIEEVFEKLSREEEVVGHIIYSDREAIVHPDIHFGPFSKTGSSNFPSLLRNKFREKGVEAIVLHGMGSHDRNLATHKESEKLVHIYTSVLEKKLGDYIEAGEPYTVKHREWEALVIPFSKITIAIISRPDKGIDDIPYTIQEKAYRLSIENNIPPVLLVDAHNCENSHEIETSDLEKLLNRIIEEYKSHNKFTGEYRVTVVSTKKALVSTPGAIDGVSILAIEAHGKKVGVAYIPGNNMAKGLRKIIIDIMRENGFDYAEAITNDEHTETGRITGSIYVPVQHSRELIDCIKELSREALARLRARSKKLRYHCVKTRVKIMGDTAWKLLRLYEKTYPLALKLSIIYVIVAPVALLLLLTKLLVPVT